MNNNTAYSGKVEDTTFDKDIWCLPASVKEASFPSDEINTNGDASSFIHPLLEAMEPFPHRKVSLSISDLSAVKFSSMYHQWVRCGESCRKLLTAELFLFPQCYTTDKFRAAKHIHH